MKIHEFQAKEILRKAGVAVPQGIVARTPAEAAEAFRTLGGSLAVVKRRFMPAAAARGRSRGTTSSAASNWSAVPMMRRVAGNLIGQSLVTIQTGPAGQTVRQVLVEQGCDIARELYLGIVVDRAASGPVLMVSSEGGVNIEDVAAKTPELIYREKFSPTAGLEGFQVRKLAAKLGLKGASVASAEKFMKGLCRVFLQNDCSLAEINPLVVTGGGDLLALDAKMTFDDNALFRHKDLAELRDVSEEEPAEVRAGAAGLSYVKLEGNIGCLVNGAGLAMSTMDLIKLHGGAPGQLSGRRRRRERRPGHRGISNPAVRQKRESSAGQYFRRHHALHNDRQRRSGRLQDGRFQRAAGSAAGRDRGRGRAQDPRLERRGHYCRRRPDRRRQKGRRGRRLAPIFSARFSSIGRVRP